MYFINKHLYLLWYIHFSSFPRFFIRYPTWTKSLLLTAPQAKSINIKTAYNKHKLYRKDR